MPLTAAEKQRKYRERLKINNPEKYETIKKNNAERTKNKKKKIADCSEEEKKAKRERWIAEKRKIRVNQTVKDDVQQQNKREEKRKYQRVYRSNIKFQSTIALQKKHIKSLQKQLNRYKAKCETLTKNITALVDVQVNKKYEQIEHDVTQQTNGKHDLTPQTKTDLYMKETFSNIPDAEKQKVKKQLLQHNVLVHSLTQKYKKGSNNEKDVLKSVAESDVVKKYKLKSKIAGYLGLKGKIRRSHDIKKKRSAVLKSLKDFYERDDVSRATAGKKDVKTFKKEKRQRRYLLQPLRQLYKKYKSEKGRFSFSTFKKYRPFYILPPKLSNRETCACVKHDNMAMKLTKLNSLGLTEIKNTEDLLTEVMCDVKSKDCAYNECVTCNNKSIALKHCDVNMNDNVCWNEWTLQSLEYTNKESKKIKAKRMFRNKTSESLTVLVQKFEKELITFKKHCFNISHQYGMYRKCLETLDDDSAIVHVDFSENYGCKHSTEVQAMHFGASKVQVTLHTGLLYCKGKEPISFCTISPCNNHGPEAIWAHLDPILKLIKEEFPRVSGIHFYSDGPTSQYRQKKNFFFFQKISKQMGFPNSTWNFFEAAHGKGAADGIGGAIKRKLDQKVAYGENIPDAETAFAMLCQSDTKIKVFYIPDSAINLETNDKEKSIELTPIPGTIHLHQIRNTPMNDTIAYRDLSCFCESGSPKGYCQCLIVKNHNLRKKQIVPSEESAREMKKAKVITEDESYCESDYSVRDTSDDESYEQWKDNVKESNISITEPTVPLLKPTKKSPGSHVIFKYDDNLYPGIIVSVNEEGALISAMKRSLRLWKWPEKKDELLYSWDDVLGCIESPKLISKRGLFSVPELDFLEK